MARVSDTAPPEILAVDQTQTARAVTPTRNPGPSWGYTVLQAGDRWLPRWFVRAGVAVGVAIAVMVMPRQRAHSRAYLQVVRGRRPTGRDIWRHFHAFTNSLLTKLRAGGGTPHRCEVVSPTRDEFLAFARQRTPALFGTMHLGHSDLLGFLLSDLGRRVAVVRLRVGNSRDTDTLGRRFGERVEFLWVNEPANIPFAIKGAIERGVSVAMKCDRPEFSARLEPFEFLGARRLFPFTIYHVALVFGLPVAHCIGVPGTKRDTTLVYCSSVFRPSGERAADLAAARRHFQTFLSLVEDVLREQPQLWFNFGPLNPVVAPAGEAAAAEPRQMHRS